MKKIIIACLAFISLVSCSNNAIEQEQPVRTAAIETTTEAEIPPTTEPQTVDEVLYKDDNCSIIYNNFQCLKTVQRLYLTVNNNTEYNLRAIASDFKVNGISIKDTYSVELEPKNTVSNFMTIINSHLQEEDITRVNSVDFKVQITVWDAANNTIASYDTNTITITR